jgi:hypothetical protein
MLNRILELFVFLGRTVTSFESYSKFNKISVSLHGEMYGNIF